MIFEFTHRRNLRRDGGEIWTGFRPLSQNVLGSSTPSEEKMSYLSDWIREVLTDNEATDRQRAQREALSGNGFRVL